MILVYGDESMDETKERVCAVAGVFGTEEEWKSLESQWASRLGDIPFHAKDCDSDRGDYAAFSHEENKRLYRDLTTLLANSGLKGVGFALDLIAAREFFPNSLHVAYHRAFWQLVDTLQDCAKDNCEIVEFNFDTRVESDHNAALLYADLRSRTPGWEDTLAEKVSFISSETNVRIQVADLMARESMKYLDNITGPKKRPPRGAWKALEATGNFEVHTYEHDFFAAMRSEMEANSERLTKRAEEYQAWLKAKRRTDNTTNLLVFMALHNYSLD